MNPGNRTTREKACREISGLVGVSYCDRGDGWDAEILSLADRVSFDPHSVLQRPARVAREITAYLDDIVRNP